MSLFGSLTSSVSALGAQGEGISVISDNLANVNTIGYKGNRSMFAQMVTSSGSGGTQYNAGGVSTAISRSQNVQGSLLSTSNETDLAISGEGFFIVTDSEVNTTDTNQYYTRAGAFVENAAGFLVNADGLYLNGWETDSDGNITDLQDIKPIELQSVGASARETTEVNIGANLTSSEGLHAYNTTSTLATQLSAVVADPTEADYATDVRLYDSQGNARDVSVGFVKRSQNLWDWVMYTDASNIFGGTAGSNAQIGSGTVRFDEDGKLLNATGLDVTANWADGAGDGALTINFGEYTGGKVATAGAGLTFDDGVLDISVDSGSLADDTYTVRWSAANTLELVDSSNAVVGSTTVPSTSSTRSVEFSSGGTGLGVFMTISSEITDPGAGYPVAEGTFTTASVAASGDGNGTDGMLQYSASYNTFFAEQDGFTSGSLGGVSVDEEGFVIGNFTNGESKKLWKVAIGLFPNSSAMEQVSGTLLKATDASGAVLVKGAGVGSTGTISSGSLEQSTVDIANEFSTMIVTQRAYQAASSAISTVDQMLNDLVQLR